MNVMIFVTEDQNGGATGPILFVAEHAGATLPANPRSLEWRYVATSPSGDGLLEPDERATVMAVGACISDRLFASSRLGLVMREQQDT